MSARHPDELVLCLCLEDSAQCDVVIQGISSGHVFGPSQPLHLMLCGSNTSDLEGLRMDIEDCTFPLVKGTSVVNSLSGASVTPHVVMVFLSQREARDHSHVVQFGQLPRLIDFITDISDILSSSPALCDQKVLIVGDLALTASSLLSRKLKCLSSSQLLAIDSDEPSAVLGRESRRPKTSQYGLLSRLCTTVSHWWTGPQEKRHITINLGTKFLDTKQRSSSSSSSSLPSFSGYFFSTPVDIHSPQSFSMCLDKSVSIDHIVRCKEEQDRAIRLLASVDDQQREAEGYVIEARL
ncbi:uncharacterized protein LOC101851420 [Aplysia californica]|uniref:Uncharacterized protein LOC101851420 n=1 Tax=Aplysia californica TaxID=6500 RepID=A0ABM0JT73_APLCA|nr:uncharacterized protein LOC101851420 [Aplysia californica]